MRRVVFLLAACTVTAAPLQAQQFGASAAIGDREIYIGEPVNPNAPATIHIYRRSGDGWVAGGTLAAPEAGGESNYFGRFIVLDDQSLIIGGTTYEQSTGTVWVYQRAGEDWDFVGTMRPDKVVEGDSFGRFGLLHDDLLFVTALGHNESRGAIWVYQRDASGAWTQEAKLEPADVPAQEFFGWSLAFDGERLLTGALQASQELQQLGAAYIFRRDAPGDWVQEAKLVIDEEQSTPFQGLGSSVAWLNGIALVGAPGRDEGTGEVRTFRRERATGEWVEGVTLSSYDRVSGAGFGASLSPGDGELWVGAPGADQTGQVYRFAFNAETGRFGSASKLGMLDADVGDGFGSMIAAGSDVAVVGAIGDDFGLGSATIMARDGDSWRPASKVFGPTPGGLDPIVAGEVLCEDGKANQFECDQVDILSFLPVAGIGGGRGAQTNDVWGWTDPQTGREYALVGRTDGTAFIDVSNASDPVYLGNLPKTEGSRGNSWRDIKVYEDHAFIVADGAGDHGMQVFDLTRLRDVTDAPVTFDEDAHYDGIASSHNIVINEESGFAYSVGSNSGGETCGGGLHMIDIREPTRPTFRGCFADTNTGNQRTGYSHDAMCIEYHGPDTEHAGKEVCFGLNESALSVADVTDKDNPVAISSADYPNVGYAHQGWITEDHRYFYMNDEGDESNAVQAGQPMPGTRTLIWDVADLDDPVMVKEHFGSTFTIDHNLYIKGDLMYQSNYVSGLRILDISDPENPEEIGFLDTVPESDEVTTSDGSWSNYPFFESGTIVVTSQQQGVFFLKHRRPELVP